MEKTPCFIFQYLIGQKMVSLTIPGLKNKIVSAKLLANGVSLKTEKKDDGVIIKIPEKALDENATVIKVEVLGG